MSRISSLLTFLIINYKRSTKLVLEILFFAAFIGIIFDPRWKPYNDQYIILGKGIFLLIFGVSLSFRFTKVQYSGQLAVVLSRINRKWFILASICSCLLVSIVFSLLMDMYLLVVLNVSVGTLFGLSRLMMTLFNLLIIIAITHLFSIYITEDYLLRLLGAIIVGFGAMPNWYQSLPFSRMWNVVAYLFPPLGQNILMMIEGQISLWGVMFSFFYSGIILLLLVHFFEKRSLNDLYY